MTAPQYYLTASLLNFSTLNGKRAAIWNKITIKNRHEVGKRVNETNREIKSSIFEKKKIMDCNASIGIF